MHVITIIIQKCILNFKVTLCFYPDRNALQSFAVFSAIAPREEKWGGGVAIKHVFF